MPIDFEASGTSQLTGLENIRTDIMHVCPYLYLSPHLPFFLLFYLFTYKNLEFMLMLTITHYIPTEFTRSELESDFSHTPLNSALRHTLRNPYGTRYSGLMAYSKNQVTEGWKNKYFHPGGTKMLELKKWM